MDDDTLNKMMAALNLFHKHKDAILAAGVHKGKSGPIDNWYILKLEFMQSVIASIQKHAHISKVKDPSQSGNNQNHEQQGQMHQIRSNSTAGVDLGTSSQYCHSEDSESSPLLLYSMAALLEQIEPVGRLLGSKRCVENYFLESYCFRDGKFPNAPQPYRTFTSPDNTTAFHLQRDHVGRQLTVDEAAPVSPS
ncbi:hypothetical protein C8J57DRAFT_1262461 [Mycena rebaudengoi]|nr:hypothetical protein C8J57DRAFT_1262461 [Mycena rebaudengoi]